MYSGGGEITVRVFRPRGAAFAAPDTRDFAGFLGGGAVGGVVGGRASGSFVEGLAPFMVNLNLGGDDAIGHLLLQSTKKEKFLGRIIRKNEPAFLNRMARFFIRTTRPRILPIKFFFFC